MEKTRRVVENGGDAEACRSRPIKVSADRVTCDAVRPADAPSYRRRGLTLTLVQTVAAANLRLCPIDRQWIHSDSQIGINWCEMAPRVDLFSCFCAPPPIALFIDWEAWTHPTPPNSLGPQLSPGLVQSTSHIRPTHLSTHPCILSIPFHITSIMTDQPKPLPFVYQFAAGELQLPKIALPFGS